MEILVIGDGSHLSKVIETISKNEDLKIIVNDTNETLDKLSESLTAPNIFTINKLVAQNEELLERLDNLEDDVYEIRDRTDFSCGLEE